MRRNGEDGVGSSDLGVELEGAVDGGDDVGAGL